MARFTAANDRDRQKASAIRRNEDAVLKNAGSLDPSDTSTRAEQIREAAEDIADRRG